MHLTTLFRAAVSLAVIGVIVADSGFVTAQERVKRGEYLATIMDCGGCHTTGALRGQPDPERYLAGSDVGFKIPGLGIFYPPNLTPDPVAGLGKWSEADIVKAIRTGERPDGRILAPVMPYDNYAKLTDADARALAAYLKNLKPNKHRAPAIVAESDKPRAPYLAIVMPE